VDRLDCGNPEIRDVIAAAERGEGRLVVSRGNDRWAGAPADTWQQYGGEFGPGPAPGFAARRGGVALPFAELDPGRYTAFIQGAYGRGGRLMIGNAPVGDVFGDLGLHSGWHPLGTVVVQRADPVLAFVGLNKPWWQAGSHRGDVTGPLVFVEDYGRMRLSELPGSRARSLCGRTLDWLELI
jgi:hypothetical protein